MPTLAQVYEDHAADCTRAAEQTDDPVFRKMLLILALQWRLAAREAAAMQSTQPKRSYIVAEGCDYIKPATAV